MKRMINELGGKKSSSIKWFLLLGIFVLSLSLVLSSCGRGPQKKVLVENGPYALHFPMTDPECADGGTAQSLVSMSGGVVAPHVTDTDFTIESWVKTAPTSANNTDKGVIFSFGGVSAGPDDEFGGGFALYLWKQTSAITAPSPPNNCPSDAPNGRCVKFVIVDIGPDRLKGTADDTTAIAVANNDIVDGTWHHVAAVLDGTTMTVYVDGALGASTTDPAFPPNPNVSGIRLINYEGRLVENKDTHIMEESLMANIGSNLSGFAFSNMSGGELGAGPAQAEEGGARNAATYIFSTGDFAVDEMRLWDVARTQAEINTNKDQELVLDEIDPTILKGYWRFNQNSGFTVPDASGHGMSGGKARCSEVGGGENGCGGPEFAPLTKCRGGWIPGAI